MIKDRIFHNVKTTGDAERILAEMGIKYDNFFTPTFVETSPFTGEKKYYTGIHIYYQDENFCDLAYYTVEMDCLYVMAVPRPTKTTPTEIVKELLKARREVIDHDMCYMWRR